MATDNLKQKAASGMIWTAVQKYSTMIVNFISGIILARLLTPDDYGCIGMLAIFMALAENFVDGGFGSALIQKKNPTQVDYSTVFYFNMGMSSFIYLVLFFSAPFIAEFYNMPLLCDILRVQGLVLFIYALNVIQRNQIRKHLQFKKLSKIQITTSILSLIVTIIMAYNGCGVWSLVTQNILAAVIPCVFFWVTTTWRPTLEYSWKSFRELFGFGSYILFSHLFNTFSDKISGLLIGRVFSASTMGYYSKASSTERLASNCIQAVMVQTTYPMYASVQDDKERLANMIKRLAQTLAYITVPFILLLMVIAKPFFLLLYTEKWLPCVPYFQILCFAGLASCLQGVNHQSIAAIGKSRVIFIWTVIKRTVSIIVQILGLYLFGLEGLLVGMVVTSWFGYVVNTSLVSKYIGYKNFQQYMDLMPVFVVSCLCALASWSLNAILDLNVYIIAALQITLFVSLYLGWSIIFKPEAYKYTMSIVEMLIKKIK